MTSKSILKEILIVFKILFSDELNMLNVCEISFKRSRFRHRKG